MFLVRKSNWPKTNGTWLPLFEFIKYHWLKRKADYIEVDITRYHCLHHTTDDGESSPLHLMIQDDVNDQTPVMSRHYKMMKFGRPKSKFKVVFHFNDKANMCSHPFVMIPFKRYSYYYDLTFIIHKDDAIMFKLAN